MASKRIVVFCSILLVVIGLSSAYGVYNLFDHNAHNDSGNPVDKEGKKLGLPEDVIKILEPMGANGTIDGNTMSVMQEIASLGHYADASCVISTLKSIVSDGHISGMDVVAMRDPDHDYIVSSLDPNPVNPDVSGTGIGDFNLIYVYGIDPNNSTAVHNLLKNIPNVPVKAIGTYDGNTPLTTQKLLDISKIDPIVEYYAKKVSTEWTDSNHGKLLVDGSPAYNGVEPLDLCQPSYYLTHGRMAACDSAIAITSLLSSAGFDAKLVEASIPVHHYFTEVLINGKEYVVNFNDIMPASEFFASTGYVPEATYVPK